MKKTLLSLSILASAFTLHAQSQNAPPVVLTNAPDFTITTTDGVTRNLYTTLAQGKTIMLDFFFTTCSYCIQYAPTIEQAYQAHGAGTGNFEIWGIDNGDNNAQVIAYRTQYGVTNPCASGTEGGADPVLTQFQA